jgi:glyoxylase-like metal-dependent hydrolase (beta-lactamase superfamily II)
MNIQALETGPLASNCYLVWGDEKQAVVFDPGYDAARITDALEKQGLEVAAYVCTHGHIDHISALADLHADRPAPVAMHSDDLAWAFEPDNCLLSVYPSPARPEVDEFHRLDRARDWTFADLSFECIETPGHTPGSCCLFFADSGILITGDTLFKGSCGRTDRPGGSPRQMKESLGKLKKLPGAVRVYPGHGLETRIDTERATNYYMR